MLSPAQVQAKRVLDSINGHQQILSKVQIEGASFQRSSPSDPMYAEQMHDANRNADSLAYLLPLAALVAYLGKIIHLFLYRVPDA